MSGGHWDYSHFRIRDGLENVGEDGNIILRFPKLAQVFRDLAGFMDDTINDLDYDLSGDTEIENDKDFEEKAIRELLKILSKKHRVLVYDIKIEEGE